MSAPPIIETPIGNMALQISSMAIFQLKWMFSLQKFFIYLVPNLTQFYCREFCHGVYNQYESFICLDLMIKTREVSI
jgi:hypothetical protein